MKVFQRTIFLILPVLIFIGGIFVTQPKAMQLSDREQQALLTLEKVRKYEKSIGILPILDFKDTNKEDPTVNVFYQKKTDMAFSYLDPLLNFRLAELDDSQSLGVWLPPEIDISQYDFYLYSPEANANGLRSFDSLIYGLFRMVSVVIHEDWHNNVSLPLHIEEASAALIGEVGAVEFIGVGAEKEAQIYFKHHIMVNDCYGELSRLSGLYAEGKIAIGTYNAEKEKIYKKYRFNDKKLNPARIAYEHTYSYYFPLMYKLFIAERKNLKRTVEFLKRIKVEEPAWRADRKLYFRETLEAELKIEKIIEEEIGRLK